MQIVLSILKRTQNESLQYQVVSGRLLIGLRTKQTVISPEYEHCANYVSNVRLCGKLKIILFGYSTNKIVGLINQNTI